MADWYLVHYGIEGQKWGLRRYQYEDGTLTPEGRKRYGIGEGIKVSKKQLAKLEKKVSKQERKEAYKEKKSDLKNRRVMSDYELQYKLQRLRMEKELKQLTDEQIYSGRDYATGIMKDAGRRVLTNFLAGAATYGVQTALGAAGKSSTYKDFGYYFKNEFDAGKLGEYMAYGGPKKK